MDCLVLELFAVCGHSLLVSMLDELAKILGHQCIHDVKKILPWWSLALGIHGREVSQELGILLHLGPQVLHGQLVIMGHRDELHLRLVEQVLVFGNHCLQEVFVDDVFGRHVVLYCRGVRQKAKEYLRC